MFINQSKIHGLVALYFKLLFLPRFTQRLFQWGPERANLKVGFCKYEIYMYCVIPLTLYFSEFSTLNFWIRIAKFGIKWSTTLMPLDNIFTILFLLLVTRNKKSKVKLWERHLIVRSGRKHAWLSPINTGKFMACCKICLKSFWIDNSGLSQVKCLEKCHKLGQALFIFNQRTF